MPVAEYRIRELERTVEVFHSKFSEVQDELAQLKSQLQERHRREG